MDTKHTPTPWAVTDRWHVITDANGQWLADTVTVLRNKPEEAANAAFIVRAANSHDQLVAALQQIERLTREGTRDGHLIRDAVQEIAAKALSWSR